MRDGTPSRKVLYDVKIGSHGSVSTPGQPMIVRALAHSRLEAIGLAIRRARRMQLPRPHLISAERARNPLGRYGAIPLRGGRFLVTLRDSAAPGAAPHADSAGADPYTVLDLGSRTEHGEQGSP